MFYLYPHISFATVNLEHYNLWAQKMQLDGNMVKNQTSAASSNWAKNPKSRWFKHSLLCFLINLPVGISYPLSDAFTVFSGFNPIFGYSSNFFNFWTTSNASLSSTSLGLGFEAGGDFSLSKQVSFSVRLGYDAINFKKYSGEKEERSSDGTLRIKPAFLIFDLDESELKIKENYPNPSAGEIWGENMI